MSLLFDHIEYNQKIYISKNTVKNIDLRDLNE